MNKTNISCAVIIICISSILFAIALVAMNVFTFNNDEVILEDNKLEEVKETNDETEENKKEIEEVSIEEIISLYKPNELGDIPVIMYHAVCENPPSVYQRSIEGFKEDLQYMYDHGYRTISCKDFVSFNITTEVGMTPILLTFDDGDYRSFALERDENGNLVPEKNCAVYLMEEFYSNHPDFGKNAIFFINGHNATFQGKDKTITLEERINWLLSHGYEVSNHTDGHINIKNSTPETIVKNIAKVDKLIKDTNNDVTLNVIAYPFGAKPTTENEKYILNGTYDGHSYSYVIGLREGPSKARFVPVIHTDYEPLNTPRLRGNKGEVGDMHSYFESYEKNPNLRFISDGNRDTIVVPIDKENKINKELDIVKNKQIITY